MDAAGSGLHLTGMSGVMVEDKRIVFECVKEHGIDEAALTLYRIFFAFRFLASQPLTRNRRSGAWAGGRPGHLTGRRIEFLQAASWLRAAERFPLRARVIPLL